MNKEEEILQTLSNITDISNDSKFTFKDKLQKILLEIVKAINTEKGSIMIIKGKKLEIYASTDLDLIGIKQSIDKESPSTWVVKNKKLLYVDSLTLSKQLPLILRQHNYNKEAFIIAPIIAKKKIFGVICLTEKKDSDYFLRTEQESLLNMVAYIIGVLESNRLSELIVSHKHLLLQKNQQLIKLEKLRTDLFNMLIHDLKGPISEIVANLDILNYLVTPENLEYVESAQSACDTLFRMMSNLLDIARLEEGSLKLLLENIEPQSIISESISRIHTIAKNRNIKIIKKIQSNKSLFLIADKDMLLRVMQNLIMNAIHYSTEGERIEIGFELTGLNKVTFFVNDNGPGIKSEFQDAIFGKYIRVDSSSNLVKRSYNVGLGLAFCKLAVIAHKGKIFVESDGKSGSSFKFTLPLKQIEKTDEEFKL